MDGDIDQKLAIQIIEKLFNKKNFGDEYPKKFGYNNYLNAFEINEIIFNSNNKQLIKNKIKPYLEESGEKH